MNGKCYTFKGQRLEKGLYCIFQATGNIVLQRCRASMTKHRQQSTRVRNKGTDPLWSQVCSLLQNYRMNSALPLLGVYLKEWKAESWRDICACMLKAAAFRTAKRWKQPKYPSIYRWLDKQNVVLTYNGILFNLKKEGNFDSCYNMDDPWGHHAKWNKPVTKSQIPYDYTDMRHLEESAS